jgi:hypothetical protein
MKLRSANTSKSSRHNKLTTQPSAQPAPPQPLKLAPVGKKKSISDREWAARHGRGFIEPPTIVKGAPVRLPVKESNGRHMVQATPPIGDVPDPNNAGNVLICHQKPDLNYVTLSIPPASLPLYQTPNNSDGACTPAGTTYCPPGSAPDCAGICNGTSIVDCDGNCYNPVNTPAAYLLDCAGVCYDTTTIPLNVPDCNGVCGGSAVVDCDGVCDGSATQDCAGVCNGTHFVDCGGNCNTTCAEVASSLQAKKTHSMPNKIQAAPQPQAPKVVQTWTQQLTKASPTHGYILKAKKRR